MQCPKCGVENDDKLKFCRACGGALASNLPAAPEPLATTEPLPPAAPPTPPAPAPPPPAAPPPAAPVPPAYAPPPPVAAPAPARHSNVLPIVLVVVGVFVVLAIIGGVAAYKAYQTMSAQVQETVTDAAKNTPQADVEGTSGSSDEEAEDPKKATGSGATSEGESDTPPVSADDPVAEAQVVLEKYLAADLGSNGEEMGQYLGGQAKARFNPDVVGQEDVTVHSKQVTGHDQRDDNTIYFTVTVEWSPAGSQETKSQEDPYVLKRTDEGWLIFGTPEFPYSE